MSRTRPWSSNGLGYSNPEGGGESSKITESPGNVQMPPKTEYMEGMTVGQETELGEMSRARECGHLGHVTPFLLYPASYRKQGVAGIR